MLINVQFSNSTDGAVIAYFGSPQSSATYSNLSQIDTSDTRWETFYNALPASMQDLLPAPAVMGGA